MIIETGRNNYKQQHPMVTIRNTALDQILRLSDRYGLDPVSRRNFQAPAASSSEKEPDEFLDY